jgi:antitoxin component YwqK of YwqJK toxin-antitoxin module
MITENKMTYYFKNGKVKADGFYENDLMEGEWNFYRIRESFGKSDIFRR